MLQKRQLGKSGLWVSPLCFGALTIGPLQNNTPLAEGAAIIRRALELGVNFIDTAQLYGTYEHIRLALVGWTGDVVIASKSYACDRDGMRESLEECLDRLGRNSISLFMLHEQESALTLKGHRQALEYLVEARERGIIKAAGLSTHTPEGVRAGAYSPEIDVISPLYNTGGIGLFGNQGQMLDAILEARSLGKGIYGMKPLGGGHLIENAGTALRQLLELRAFDSIAVGMKSIDEVEYNVRVFSGEVPPDSLAARIKGTSRKLHIEDWCTGCGECAGVCGFDAMTVVDGRAHNRPERCVLCGYCGAACPEFAIKVI